MAQAFCGTRISPRMSRDNAGNLVCHGAVIARSGRQTYRGLELGLATDELIEVLRPASEVLSAATIASAQGKLITDNHPPGFLAPWNAAVYAKGVVLNPREGPTLPNGDKTLVADLVIHDPSLISKILDGGLRELSAGYDTQYEETSDGKLEQRQIRINHLAFVPTGRCGAACRVQDKEPAMTEEERERLWKIFVELVAESQQTQDCSAEDREFRAKANTADNPDRAFGERARQFHRGGTPESLSPRTEVNDSDEKYETLLARYRRQRWGL